MTKILSTSLALGALFALLPLAAPAAAIPIASGQICFDTDSPNPTVFPNGFVAYDYLCMLNLQVGANPGSGGFNSLLGQDGSRLTFLAGGLELIDFSPPDTTGPVFLEYGFGSTVEPEDSWAMFPREITDPLDPNYGSADVLLFGSLVSLRFEADGFPAPDGSHTVQVFAHIVLDMVGFPGDPLAEAFYAELMALTNNTGSLYLNATATLYEDFLELGATQWSTVPEPATVAGLLAAVALSLCVTRRKLVRARSSACGNVTGTFPS